MDQQWIIEVVDRGEPTFICEERGELYLTRRRHEAEVYASELDTGMCTRCYVADRYQPRIVPAQVAARG